MDALPSLDPGIEINAFSQGMSKGLRQTDGVQILVRPELAIGSLTLDAYYKNVTSPTADGEAEVRLGLHHRFAGVELTLSGAYKWSTNAHLQADRDSLEFTVGASRRFGRMTPHLSLVYSPDDLGRTGASLYAEAGVSASVVPGLSLSANLARREREGAPDYVAFNAGATWALTRNVSADLRYYDTAQSRLGAIYRPRLVAALKLHF